MNKPKLTLVKTRSKGGNNASVGSESKSSALPTHCPQNVLCFPEPPLSHSDPQQRWAPGIKAPTSLKGEAPSAFAKIA